MVHWEEQDFPNNCMLLREFKLYLKTSQSLLSDWLKGQKRIPEETN